MRLVLTPKLLIHQQVDDPQEQGHGRVTQSLNPQLQVTLRHVQMRCELVDTAQELRGSCKGADVDVAFHVSLCVYPPPGGPVCPISCSAR